MEKDINTLLDEARFSLTEYCTNVCKSGCCKKGKLLLQTKDEVDLVVGDSSEVKKAIEINVLEKQETGNFHYNLEKVGQCKNLCENGLCSVYKNPSRPVICHDYPLFKVGEYVITASNCMAVQNNILDSKLSEIKKLGFKVI